MFMSKGVNFIGLLGGHKKKTGVWRWKSASGVQGRQTPMGKTHPSHGSLDKPKRDHANNEVGSWFELLQITCCHRTVVMVVVSSPYLFIFLF